MSDTKKNPEQPKVEKVTKKLTLERKVVNGGLAVKTSVRAGCDPVEWKARWRG